MNNTIPARSQWAAAEDTILRQMDAAGASNQEICAVLPKHSIGAVRRRRQETIGKRQRRGKTKATTPLEWRIVALEATVAKAMQGRVDWLLVDEYLQGLEWLRAR